MKPETIKIDEVEYVRKDLSPNTTGEIRIVVLQRGWVAVGRFSENTERCILKNANIIRVWGTTKGLGEIAVNGPTSKTVLDKCPDIRFHELTVVMTIDCVESVWNTKLS